MNAFGTQPRCRYFRFHERKKLRYDLAFLGKAAVVVLIKFEIVEKICPANITSNI